MPDLGKAALNQSTKNTNNIGDLSILGQAPRTLTESIHDRGLSIKDYGAKGDGIDDTAAFLAWRDYVKTLSYRPKLVIPKGQFVLKQPLPIQSWLDISGQGVGATEILIDHDGIGFDFIVGDDPGLPYQGGASTISQMTIKRKTKPTAKKAGNYAIRMHGTFGNTNLEKLLIRDMGDSAIMIDDDTKYRGTGPVHFSEVDLKSNLYGYGLEVLGCFANIFGHRLHSWGNAGGYNFDASSRDTTKANYYPYQIVLRDCDSEFAGGYITTAGSTTPTAPIRYPVVRARNIRGLFIDASTLITTKNSGQHVIDLDYCENVVIGGGTAITSDGGSTSSGIWLGFNCENVKIDNINLYGSDNSQYGIISEGVKGLFISNPKITGFKYGGDLNLKTLFNAVHTLKITSGSTAAGNISITVGGVQRTIVVATGDSIAAVMTAISNTAFTGYILTNNGVDTVTFTATATGYKAPLTLNAGTTGVTGNPINVNTGQRKAFVESEERGGYISNDYIGTTEDTQANYGSRAWASFKWDTAGSYITLEDSQNVASVTRSNVGKFLVTFKTPFANTSYGVTTGGRKVGGSSVQYVNRTASSVELWCYDNTGTLVDWDLVSVDINAR